MPGLSPRPIPEDVRSMQMTLEEAQALQRPPRPSLTRLESDLVLLSVLKPVPLYETRQATDGNKIASR